MLFAPALHPRDVLRAAKVVLVLGLGKPPALTGRFARLTARGGVAIPLDNLTLDAVSKGDPASIITNDAHNAKSIGIAAALVAFASLFFKDSNPQATGPTESI
jgi:hypothetical protein